MKWLRLYDDFLFNAKVQSLPLKLFKAYVNCLCLASKNDPRGELPSNQQIAFALHVKIDSVPSIMDALIEVRLIQRESELYQVCNWDAYQQNSDDSAIRVRKHRINKIDKNVTVAEQSGNGTEKSRVESRVDKIREEKNIQPAAVDLAYEGFVGKHAEYTGTAYVSTKGDFIQLNILRKANGVLSKALPEGWPQAVEYYFASPMAKYSLADLCCRYPVFKNSALDKYGKPLSHQGVNGYDRSEESKRAVARFIGQVDARLR